MIYKRLIIINLDKVQTNKIKLYNKNNYLI